MGGYVCWCVLEFYAAILHGSSPFRRSLSLPRAGLQRADVWEEALASVAPRYMHDLLAVDF